MNSTASHSMDSLAILGASPAFPSAISCGQQYFPDWERYEKAFNGIFERQYYTNQGPLASELERRLQAFLGVKHAVCVTNDTIALVMAAEAMGLKGKVILPAISSPAAVHSLGWVGLEPVFCDIDADTGHIDPTAVAALVDKDTSAILGVNPWGGRCDEAALHSVAERYGLKIFFDSSQAFGVRPSRLPPASRGQVDVYSFSADHILNATEGGCICTDDDMLAARLRNIRSSYGAGAPVDVDKTSNGRMSEAQAALALLALDDFETYKQRNKALFERYLAETSMIPGLRAILPGDGNDSNYQQFVCEVREDEFGLDAEALVEALKAENVHARMPFHPLGNHAASVPCISTLKNAATLGERLVEMPLGAHLSLDAVGRIGQLARAIHARAPEIRRRRGG